MKRIFVLLSLVLALIIASTTWVLAKGPSVKDLAGTYAMTETRYCVQTDGVFGDGPEFPLPTNMSRSARSTQIRGTLILLSNESGTFQGVYYTIFNNIQEFPIDSGNIQCSVQFFYLGNGAFALILNNCVGTATYGGQIGLVTQILTPIHEVAFPSIDLDTLMISQAGPEVEHLQWTTQNGTEHRQRMCNRTGTAILMTK